MLTICQEILDQMITHAEKEYPSEACGILLGEKGRNSVTEFRPLPNSYDRMHRKFPETYPRDSRTAYLIDPMTQERLFEEAQKEGLEVKAVFHSHADHGAYFSEEDRLVAAPWGEPMYPGVSYIVISIYGGKFKEANQFYWDDKKGGFYACPRSCSNPVAKTDGKQG